MPTELPPGAIEAADAAVIFAQQVRRIHARRTPKSSEQRKRDIALALEKLSEAMVPLRRESGRFIYGPQTYRAEANRDKIRESSAALQRERRKLWKMQTKED